MKSLSKPQPVSTNKTFGFQVHPGFGSTKFSGSYTVNYIRGQNDIASK